MIQKKWFRIEHLKDGSLGEVTEVDTKGRSGSNVRFYEALTKTDACKQAKEWYEKYRANSNAGIKRLHDKRLSAGLCISCGESPRCISVKGISRHCRECLTHVAELAAARRAGTPVGRPQHKDPVKTKQMAVERNVRGNETRKEKYGSLYAYNLACLLTKFDAIGPLAFRQWLVDKIADAQSKAKRKSKNTVKLPRNKKSRIDWFEDKLSDKAAE